MNVNHVIVSGVLAGFIVSSFPLLGTVAAQSAGAASQTIWENDHIQVRRVTLAPGERFSGDSTGGSVVVFLTTDLDGRIPSAEAAWRDPGPVTLENRGRGRFEAWSLISRRHDALRRYDISGACSLPPRSRQRFWWGPPPRCGRRTSS